MTRTAIPRPERPAIGEAGPRELHQHQHLHLHGIDAEQIAEILRLHQRAE